LFLYERKAAVDLNRNMIDHSGCQYGNRCPRTLSSTWIHSGSFIPANTRYSCPCDFCSKRCKMLDRREVGNDATPSNAARFGCTPTIQPWSFTPVLTGHLRALSPSHSRVTLVPMVCRWRGRSFPSLNKVTFSGSDSSPTNGKITAADRAKEKNREKLTLFLASVW